MSPPQRVQVFAVGVPAPGVPKDRRRYRVKWRVDGRDKTRAFKTRAEADRMRSRIQVAAVEGERFDPTSGLPTSWSAAPAGPTWWSWSQEWLNLKWPQWSGHSRRTAVESLGVITPLMVRADAPPKPDDLADWLRHHGYRPGSLGWSAVPSWLEAWSVPLAEVSPALLETVLHGVSTKADSTPLVASVARRRRNTIGSILRSAVRRGILDADPMVRIEWRAPSASIAVDVALVPSPDDVEDIVDCVAELPFGSARYAALFAAIGMGAGGRANLRQRPRSAGHHEQLRTDMGSGPGAALAERPPPVEGTGLRPPPLRRHDDAARRRARSRGRPPTGSLRRRVDAGLRRCVRGRA
jgi:hypothetical protein